jgi:hypothetical protein
MVHLLHEGAVEVDEVAGHMKGRNLTPAILQDVVAGGQARKEDGTLGGAVPLPHHVLTLCDRFLPGDSLGKKLPFPIREAVVLLKLGDKRVQNGLPPAGWVPMPISVAELAREDEQGSAYSLSTVRWCSINGLTRNFLP